MKNTLKHWKGQFLINHKIYENLEDVNFKNGEKIKIKLLVRRKQDDKSN